MAAGSGVSGTTASAQGIPTAKRPSGRNLGASILVPRDYPEIEIEEEEYPPDDARAMSPRRNPADVERLVGGIRETIQRQADTFQSSLHALVERIVENRFLQDYIGRLTPTMSPTAQLGKKLKKLKGKKRDGEVVGTDSRFEI